MNSIIHLKKNKNSHPEKTLKQIQRKSFFLKKSRKENKLPEQSELTNKSMKNKSNKFIIKRKMFVRTIQNNRLVWISYPIKENTLNSFSNNVSAIKKQTKSIENVKIKRSRKRDFNGFKKLRLKSLDRTNRFPKLNSKG
jgi:hypothetical protein